MANIEEVRIRTIWQSMKGRCYSPKNVSFVNYGGRGITICQEWLIFDNYYKWYKEHYIENCTLDRINNDGNYEPSNCRFATTTEQRNNQRPRKTREICTDNPKQGKHLSRRIEYEGYLYSWTQLEIKLGLSPGTIYGRKKAGCSDDLLLISNKQARTNRYKLSKTNVFT